jgi:MFS family permease
LSPLGAGIALMPAPLAVMLAGPLAGRLTDRIDPKFILIAGLMVGAAGLTWVIKTASIDAGPGTFVLPLVVTGGGLGCGFAVVMTLGMRAVATQVAGAASGILNTFRQVGGAMGGAIAAALLESQLAHAPATYLGDTSASLSASFVSALQPALGVPAALLVCAALACLWIRRQPQDPLVIAERSDP